jgi:hypothetical protein
LLAHGFFLPIHRADKLWTRDTIRVGEKQQNAAIETAVIPEPSTGSVSPPGWWRDEFRGHDRRSLETILALRFAFTTVVGPNGVGVAAARGSSAPSIRFAQ